MNLRELAAPIILVLALAAVVFVMQRIQRKRMDQLHSRKHPVLRRREREREERR